eukprot:CAMPEP_0171284998 /NCGR_PEP_ID=MMETSP0790-20130122/68229_1 /TAXON_ID=2925 /ORGANISM="Alexandrium catenella, Strain OF101" /LENGTH=49 /DNA_ID= /DNA_START= /DNA_END= /DNA_ORIENTATION=
MMRASPSSVDAILGHRDCAPGLSACSSSARRTSLPRVVRTCTCMAPTDP